MFEKLVGPVALIHEGPHPIFLPPPTFHPGGVATEVKSNLRLAGLFGTPL